MSPAKVQTAEQVSQNRCSCGSADEQVRECDRGLKNSTVGGRGARKSLPGGVIVELLLLERTQNLDE